MPDKRGKEDKKERKKEKRKMLKDLLKVVGFVGVSFLGLYLLCNAFNVLYMLDWCYKTIISGAIIGVVIIIAIRDLFFEEYDKYED